MMDDHELLSAARNDLADALKCLLKAEIMDGADFHAAWSFAVKATAKLDALLRQPYRHTAQP